VTARSLSCNVSKVRPLLFLLILLSKLSPELWWYDTDRKSDLYITINFLPYREQSVLALPRPLVHKEIITFCCVERVKPTQILHKKNAKFWFNFNFGLQSVKFNASLSKLKKKTIFLFLYPFHKLPNSDSNATKCVYSVPFGSLQLNKSVSLYFNP
jgi:hypothetical protein